MSHVLFEIALRLAKAGAAAVLGLLLYALLTGHFGNPGSVELGLLCWLSAAGFVLLVESSPI